MLEKKEVFLPTSCYPHPKDVILKLLVIHFFSGRFAFPDDRFNMQKCWDLFVKLKVSAKYLMGRNGELWQLVPDGKKAWHVGESQWEIRGKLYSDLNRFSDGVELINDGLVEYTPDQYAKLADLIQLEYPQLRLRLQKDAESNRWVPAKDSTIVGHEHVSPGRKSDPGEKFMWDLLYELLTPSRMH